jgi:hypothetical protein
MKAAKRCKAFHLFQHWQLGQLWPAIADDRYFMGLNQHRTVDFREAEKDFFDHNGYGCLENWRAEFCRLHCPHRKPCGLAAGFIVMGKEHAVPPSGGPSIPGKPPEGGTTDLIPLACAFPEETEHQIVGGEQS